MGEIRFDGKTVIVTGAGGGLGKAYSLFFGSRGANVVVNDLGGSAKGQGADSRAADIVVQEIIKAGGKAVANYNSVEDGAKIVETAVKAFGTVHILINNAGILRDKAFKNMSDEDWDLINRVHTFGAYSCAKACWPLFRKQQFGRIINTASAAGIYGNYGQANYSAQKMGQIAFTYTLAKEGAKYNILTNCIAPIAASRMTATVMGEEQLKLVTPDFVVPTVAFLCSEQKENSGGLYELGGGVVFKLRWERATGALLKPDASLTPDAVLAKWDDVENFDKPTYPTGAADMDYMGVLEQSKNMPPNSQGDTKVNFKDKVVIVTGAGGGLGRAYAILFAKLGAKVVVNDVGDPSKVVEECKKLGAEAIGDRHSVEDGDAVVKTAIDAFGTVHVVINNAGILRDKSFLAMTDEQWEIIQAVHMRGTYKMTKAAWPHMLKQKYGRFVNTSSVSGLYGSFGQANYSVAKMAILGFSQAVAKEGEKYNILTNCIAPNAGTNMLRTIAPEEVVNAMSPDFVAPLVVALASEESPANGKVYETGCGWIGRLRWQRTEGHGFPVDVKMTPEHIAEKWEDITSFTKGEPTNPESSQETVMAFLANADNRVNGGGDEEEDDTPLGKVNKAIASPIEQTKFTYTERDVILYNLGIGAKKTELDYVYENAENFQALPTFGVIPQFDAQMGIQWDEFLPNFSPMLLLHGEQFLEIKKPIPTAGTLTIDTQLAEVLDKGKAASVVVRTITKDEQGDVIFNNESTIFVRGSGGFGGESKGADRGAATAANKVPARKPDAVVEEKTTEEQAVLYRLSGDYNPLHVDPAFAAVGKFPQPIVHGLCFFGFAGKHILKTYGAIKSIKVRFVGSVFPGETLKTEMWKEGNKVIFQTWVVERNALCISAAAAELEDGAKPKL
ncbi:hypothetical protein BCR37DRAFT_346096 [Protomyces lactucae-debilis]|uniref:Ketoreductase domain-containing protein n=1 Tax=Protomyces lactucae-debilis TaxID=2754530 RepID=A0A1Y2FIC9_PROLT|nr:uncharacterized protein BCR37DRAFT_346096 [Protomyces lactucae-debilis]ORY83683.1 hypothetical protein BCR37DRAFT_346096 [Protomyces lactucae-debilis]